MWLLLLVLLLPIVYVFYYRYKATHRFWNSKLQQYMPNVSFKEALQSLGFFSNEEHRGFFVQKLYKKYGPIFHNSWLPIFNAVTITDANIAKKILLNNQKYARMDYSQATKNEFFMRFLGISVGTSNGAVWARQRPLVNPAFTDNALFTKPFIRKCKECVVKMAKEQSVDVKDMMARMTLDVLGDTVFGYDYGYLQGKEHDLLESYHFLWEKAMGKILPMIFPVLRKLPTEFNKKVTQSLDALDREIYGLINEKRAKLEAITRELESEGEEVTEDAIVGKMKNKSLLDLMVLANMRTKLGENSDATLTDKELRDNTVIFFIAGLYTSFFVALY